MSGDKTRRLKCFILLCLFPSNLYCAVPTGPTNHVQSATPSGASTGDDLSRSKYQIPNMISREEWGAVKPRLWPKLVKLKHPVPYVLVSYFKPDMTDDKMSLQSIQRKHQAAGQPDIQSNFMIGGDGKIYEGRGWEFEPANSIELPTYNGRFIEISYIGDFNNEEHQHPVYRATWEVLEFGRDHNYLDDNFRLLSNKDKHNNNV